MSHTRSMSTTKKSKKDKDSGPHSSLGASKVANNIGYVAVEVLAGRGLASKDSNGLSDPFAVVHLEGTSFQTATIKETLDPTWKETFMLEVSAASSPLRIELWDEDKWSKPDYMGEFEIHLNDSRLQYAHLFDEWVPLVAREEFKDEDVTGDLHVRIQFYNYKPLFEKFDPLLKLLMHEQINFTTAFASLAPDLDITSRALIRVFENEGRTKHLLEAAIGTEVAKTESEGTLFRTNSVSTKMMTTFLKLVGLPYLHQTIKGVTDSYIANPFPCEIDPSRLEDSTAEADIPALVENNTRNLFNLTQSFLDAILGSVNNVPDRIRAAFHFVYHTVEDRFANAGDKAVGGFLFLRFLCPAILSPEGYLVVEEKVEPKVRRSFALVTKIIQNLANEVFFGDKEKFMVPANRFLEENNHKLEDFFRDLVRGSTKRTDSSSSLHDDRRGSDSTSHQHAMVPKFALANDLLVIHNNLKFAMEKMERILEEDEEGNSLDDAVVASYDIFAGVMEELGEPERPRRLQESEVDKMIASSFMGLLDLVDIEDTGLGLNMATVWNSEAGDPLAVVDKLCTMLYDLLRDCAHNFKGVNALQEDKRYKRFFVATGELQAVDLNMLSNKQRTAFWLNVYNIMMLHTVVGRHFKQVHETDIGSTSAGTSSSSGNSSAGASSSSSSSSSSASSNGHNNLKEIQKLRKAYMADYYYRIGGMNYTADDIRYGILRCNQKRTGKSGFIKKQQFEKNDPRLLYILSELDPRINFAATGVSMSAPFLMRFTPNTLGRDLDYLANVFLSKRVKVDTKAGTIVLPYVCDKFASDFGKGKLAVLEAVLPYLTSTLARAVKEIVPSFDVSGKAKKKAEHAISFGDYDWTPYWEIVEYDEEEEFADD